jgi:hypothetical protein
MLNVRLRTTWKTFPSGSATGLKFGPITPSLKTMTNLEGMHSYFWLTSSRPQGPVQDDVPYTTRALKQDLARVQIAWDECQASRDRNAIYGYLTAVFDLVSGGRQKIGRSAEHGGRYGFRVWIYQPTTNRLPRSFAAPPIQAGSTSGRDPSGRA